jgi:hypothetical protein
MMKEIKFFQIIKNPIHIVVMDLSVKDRKYDIARRK